jgi:hypothetical protein
MVIFPSPPGGICLGYETAVLPQSGSIFRISSDAAPLFLMIKSLITYVPSRTGLNSKISSTTTEDGKFEV